MKDGILPTGAYGLNLTGAPELSLQPLAPGHGWTPVRLRSVVAASPPALVGVGPQVAAFPLLDGAWAVVDRSAGTATRGAPEPADASGIAHPFLAAVGAVHATWAGRSALHAGALRLPDGTACLLAAPSGGGKSTTLATLATMGVPIIADDLAVLDVTQDGRVWVLAGPRGVDLRGDARTAVGAQTTPVRGRRRHRLALGPVPLRTSVRVIVHLAWADHSAPRLEPLAPAARLQALGRESLWAMPADPPDRLLALAALPAFVLQRPRTHASLAACAALLAGLA